MKTEEVYVSRSDQVMKCVRYGLALGLVLTLLVPAICWGEVLNVAPQAEDWRLEEYQGNTGWLDGQALAQSGVLSLPGLLTGTPVKQTSSDEVALAGKGFTPEVESSYRSKHPEANFALVDQVESFKVDPAKLQAFIKEGDLKP
jgi:hypothetical protein